MGAASMGSRSEGVVAGAGPGHEAARRGDASRAAVAAVAVVVVGAVGAVGDAAATIGHSPVPQACAATQHGFSAQQAPAMAMGRTDARGPGTLDVMSGIRNTVRIAAPSIRRSATEAFIPRC